MLVLQRSTSPVVLRAASQARNFRLRIDVCDCKLWTNYIPQSIQGPRLFRTFRVIDADSGAQRATAALLLERRRAVSDLAGEKL